MEIERYGIQLSRLSREDIELVRMWRNSEAVCSKMLFKKYITEQMQWQWFESLDNDENCYTVILYNGEKIGLSHIKNIDRESNCGESGIFIADTRYIDSDIPVRVSLCGLDYAFEKLGLLQLRAKMQSDNKRAIAYNKAFGYLITKQQSGTICIELTKENYYEHREKLIELITE